MGRRDALFPAGVRKKPRVHGAHGTHADQANSRLLVERMAGAGVDGDGGHGWGREGAGAGSALK